MLLVVFGLEGRCNPSEDAGAVKVRLIGISVVDDRKQLRIIEHQEVRGHANYWAYGSSLLLDSTSWNGFGVHVSFVSGVRLAIFLMIFEASCMRLFGYCDVELPEVGY